MLINIDEYLTLVNAVHQINFFENGELSLLRFKRDGFLRLLTYFRFYYYINYKLSTIRRKRDVLDSFLSVAILEGLFIDKSLYKVFLRKFLFIGRIVGFNRKEINFIKAVFHVLYMG